MPIYDCKDPYSLIKRIIKSCGIGLICCRPAFAIDPTESLSELHHTQWTTREGAPAQIGAVAQSSDGFLWFGASSGLYRFDGEHFEHFSPGDGSPPIDNNVSALLALPSGDLWIGMRFGGSYLLHGEHMTFYGEAEGLPHRSVIQFAQRGDGSMWAQTAGGLYRLAGPRWQKVGVDWDYPAIVGYSLLADSDGTLWSRGADGTFFLRPQAKSFEKSMVPGGQGSLAKCVGHVWVSDFDTGLKALSGRAFSLPGTGLGGREIGTGVLLCDREGGVWTVTYSKDVSRLIRVPHAAELLTNDKSLTLEIQELKPGQSLSGGQPGRMLEDREGNVWVTTSRGIDRFRSNKLHSAGETAGLYRAAMAADANGKIWFASNESLAVFSPGQAAPHVASYIGDTTHWISSLSTEPDGALLIGQQGLPLSRYIGNKVEAVPIPENSSHILVQATVRDPSGALWLSIAGDGAYRRDGGTWVLNGGLTDLPRAVPVTLTSDLQGRLWFGYPDDRIAVLEDGKVRTFGVVDGLNVGAVLAIAVRGKRVWVAGAENVSVYREGRFWQLTKADRSRFAGVSGVVQDDDGGLWLNGSTGIVHIPADEVALFIKDAAHGVVCETFDFEDGIDGAAPQVRPLPTALEGGDGRIWFLTDLGAYWIDPKHIQRNTSPPPVIVKAIIVNGQSYSAAGEAILPKRTKNFEVDYTALGLSIPNRVHFRYRLEGVDTDWQDAGGRRQAFYTNVPPGRRHFRVIAANEDAVWNERGAEISVVIPPAFYQTRWFDLLCGVCGIAAMWLLYRLRVHQLGSQLRTRLNARLQERERIARELHDTLLQSTQGLILLFQGFAGRLGADPMRIQMEAALDQADQLLNEARDRVADLRTTGLESDVAGLIAKVGQELLSGTSAAFSVTVMGEPRLLTSSVADDIYRVAREAVTNAARHAEASTVAVEIAYGNSDFRLTIRDDGKGLEPAIAHAGGKVGHFGLQGMRERTERMQATFNIQTRLGAGLAIQLVVPAGIAYQKIQTSPWSLHALLKLFRPRSSR